MQRGVASEYRYRDSVPNPRALVVTISIVRRNADTMAALKHRCKHTLTICNVSQRDGARVRTRPHHARRCVEIGVASTKAFTTQLAALFLPDAGARQTARPALTQRTKRRTWKALRHLPVALGSVLALEPQIMAWAEEFARKENALPRPRPAITDRAEGALKLKEIGYIHAEAYPAGELKTAAGAGHRSHAGGHRCA